MHRTTARTRWTVGLSAASAALVAVGTVATDGAQAAPPAPAAARTVATAASGTAAGTTSGTASDGLQRRLPTASLRPLGPRQGANGKTVVSVRFKKGVKAAAVAQAAPLALGARTFRVSTRSVARLTNAATYTVANADVDGFVRAMKARADVLDAAPEVFARYDATPNDPLYRTASTTDLDQATYLPGIGAQTAWDYGRSTTSVTIAVVDSGVDVTHPDLDGKILGQRNTFDNTTDVTDTVGHGTFVAGVAAAETNNGIGVAGAAWNAKILAVKVADGDGGLALTDVAEGIDWAVANGADIVNLSLGADVGSPLLASAVANARAANVIVVSSAGNSGQEGNPKSYPAAYPGVVSVGATDAKGHRAWFSEHGSWVTMAAPGIDIRSTVPLAASDYWPNDTSYAFGDGTSFSSPLVAGTMALVKGRSPGATDEQVISAVVSTATPLPGLGLGAGKLSMSEAMKAIVPTTAPTITAPTDGTTVTDSVDLTATGGMFNANVGTKIGWYLDGTRVGFSASGSPFTFFPRGYAQGAHTIEARNCTTAGACPSGGGATVSVTFALPAPSITTPADAATVEGFSDVVVTRTPLGGGIALYDGATRVGFAPDTTTDPTITVEANLTKDDGAHALEAVLCDTAGTRCDSARSAAVNVTSSSADLTRGAVTNPVFSPNGDGTKDSTSVAYTIVGPQTVRVQVVDRNGAVVRTVAAGTPKAAGTWTTTWNGKNAAGVVQPSGTYTVRISTRDASNRAGLVTASVRLDRAAPGIGPQAGTPTSFYPVVDGYKDTWRPRFKVGEASTVTLTIKNSAGSTVRTLRQSLAAGKSWTLSWDGRNGGGTLQPAGTYSARAVAVDAAGNRSTAYGTGTKLVRTKLTTKSVTLSKTGLGAYAINDGPACAVATHTGSSYASGLWLKNNCSRLSGDIAAAWFHFTAPAAVKYTKFTVRTTGRSHSAPVDVQAGLLSSQTTEYDLTYPAVRVPTGGTTTRTLSLGSLTQGGYTTSSRVMDLILFVSNGSLGPFTDWDVQDVKVTVTYQVLA